MSQQPNTDEFANQDYEQLAENLPDMLKENVKNQVGDMGKLWLVDIVLNFLPISLYQKNRIRHRANRAMRGEDVSVFEIITGYRFGVGLLIRVVIWVVLAAVALFIISQVR